jgi:hypothetical protein
MTLSCHCGRVAISIEAPPVYVNDCNCSLCRKAGALWGYFHPSEVGVEGETNGYSRDDKGEPAVEIRFCAHCGSTTHFVLTDSAVARLGNVQLGINMRLAEASELAGVELRYPDGLAWTGAGPFGYRRPAELIGG